MSASKGKKLEKVKTKRWPQGTEWDSWVEQEDIEQSTSSMKLSQKQIDESWKEFAEKIVRDVLVKYNAEVKLRSRVLGKGKTKATSQKRCGQKKRNSLVRRRGSIPFSSSLSQALPFAWALSSSRHLLLSSPPSRPPSLSPNPFSSLR